MASSYYTNTLHVNFASVLAMDDPGMVSMFQALMASGLEGFLGCPAVIYEAALVDFFENASVREEHPVKAAGWASKDTSGVLAPFKFSRRATGECDVQFKVLYCGVCHSDLHMVKNEWGFTQYPIVPGHEIVGIVTEVGEKVEKFKVGDKVGEPRPRRVRGWGFPDW
ncbi:8-hydroxygeraniol dehydrogenase-like [Dorcoceras hygrometricum]|uniref:8-hydroxygeraniol dehydrogenase-like n=1 Tax=Dorcoceras hygrometricum TaxID=472368 RepID=A0A2Z7D7I2_9LAMI|nr:8-hydroxygeraniol dehydrogenase-like [Dorcoceras hygrometricum]